MKAKDCLQKSDAVHCYYYYYYFNFPPLENGFFYIKFIATQRGKFFEIIGRLVLSSIIAQHDCKM